MEDAPTAAQPQLAPPPAEPGQEEQAEQQPAAGDDAGPERTDGARGPCYMDSAVQTTEVAEAGTQCETLAPADPQELRQQLVSPALAQFLRAAVPAAEAALQQNELADALQDEFAGLAEEDGQEGSTIASADTDRVAVHQSFSDLVHSKGRTLAAVAWHPARRGVMAVACSEPLGLADRLAVRQGGSGRPGQAAVAASCSSSASPCILVWDYRDPIHPEAVLEAPSDVFAFAFNPAQPNLVAGGCLGGQVAVWDLGQLPRQREAAARLQVAASGGSGVGAAEMGTGAAAVAAPGSDGSAIDPATFLRPNVLQPAHVSLLEASHQACISDLRWLPGLSATRDGRLEPAAAGPSECLLFATTAIDGRVLIWDVRVNAGRRRGKSMATDDEPVEWKLALVLPVQNATSQPLLSTQLAVDPKPSSTTRFLMGSLDGEMAIVDANVRQVDTNRQHNAVGHAPSSAGRVLSLAFSPFFDELLLVVAASGFNLWLDGPADLEAPLFESRFSEVFYTAGCWSPNKPGVLLLGRQDGKLEVWNLLDRIHAPVVVAPISPAAITALAFSPGTSGAASRSSTHQALAVADAAGVLHVVDLPRSLRRRGHGEIKAMSALLQREQRQREFVQGRQAIRAKLQKELEPKRRASMQFATGTALPQPAGKQQEGEAELTPEQRAEVAYRLLEEEWRAKLGLPPVASEEPATEASIPSSSRSGKGGLSAAASTVVVN